MMNPFSAVFVNLGIALLLLIKLTFIMPSKSYLELIPLSFSMEDINAFLTFSLYAFYLAIVRSLTLLLNQAENLAYL